MPSRTLVYYFTLQSPWSYLGHAPLMDIVRQHDIRLVWKPMNLARVFPESGGLPLAKRHPKRQNYREIELQRWRAVRTLPLNLRPAFRHLGSAPADRVVVALAEMGRDPDPFVGRAYPAMWAEDADLTDETTLKRLLEAAGDPVDVVLEHSKSQVVADIYEANSVEALDAGAFGAPTYVLDGEPFWGQDRLDLLENALRSGRAPFTA